MKLSRNTRFDKIDGNSKFRIRAGSGNNRTDFQVDSPQAQEILLWLLVLREEKTLEEVEQQAIKIIGIDIKQARELSAKFLDLGVLEESPDQVLEQIRDEWDKYGWRDAADFHIACRNLKFVPDLDGGETYHKIYDDLLSQPEFAGGQPPHYSPKETDQKFTIRHCSLNPEITVEDVFNRSKPINKFIGAPPDLDAVIGAIRDGFSTQRLVKGSLGVHQQRPYPSGGARHPFELYLISDLEGKGTYGTYWYDPLTEELNLQQDGIDKRAIDAACFGKGGIVSSEIFIAISCRWSRHSWKYRYSRSYRMIMLELGHLVQSLNLNFRARGIDVFQCPSLHDSTWSELLCLDDDCAEAPVYILSLGTQGIL